MLTRGGREVTAFCDAAAVRQALRADDAPPMAVLDWLMRGMDGQGPFRPAALGLQIQAR